MVMANRLRVNKQFRREIVGALGARGKRILPSETPKPIQRMFHPNSQRGQMKGYPYYQMFHELSKLPAERVFRFVNMNQLKEEILKQPGVAKLVVEHPELKQGLDQAIREGVRERGIKGAKFWKRAPKSYIDDILAAASPFAKDGSKRMPTIYNAKVGEVISSKLSGPVRERTILDIGTFSGSTIGAVVDKLSAEQKQKLKLILVDVAGKVVKENAVVDLVKLGIPRKNIKVIPASFYSAAVAFKEMKRPLHEYKEKLFLDEFRKLAGKVDFVTAGAATINFATDLNPYLRSINKLLKPGGSFVNWDWGSAESMRPTVRPAALKKVPIGFTESGQKISHFDAYTSFMNFWFRNTLKYPESVTNKFIQDMNSSRKFNSFEWLKKNATWAESEREKTKQMQAQGLLPKLTAEGKPISYERVSGPLPYRNRAYRTPSSMSRAAATHGFEVERTMFPGAEPGKLNTGNNTWLMIMNKK